MPIYSIAILRRARDADGQPIKLPDGRERTTMTCFPFAYLRSNGNTLCDAIGIAPDLALMRIEKGETDNIEIPRQAISGLTLDLRAGVVNGHVVRDTVETTALERLHDARTATTDPEARCFLWIDG